MKYSIKVGEKFERLTVLSYTDREGKKGEYKCMCECGRITYPRTWALKSGRAKSCGCLMKENISKRFKLPNNLGIVNEIYRNYKASAKKRNINFDLTIDEFKKIIEDKCYYCSENDSMSPYGFHKNIDYRYNGVDRKDNNLGYIINNVVSCCKICNNSKSTLSIDEFKTWIRRIFEKINNF